ncbi:MAG: hypothetical protein HGA65_21035, partial [Oscillochloris sp.]|nr:hypothetical protein [Oscillochloris sp.]
MAPPNDLRLAIAAALRGVNQNELRAAAAALSERYRAGHAAAAGPPGGGVDWAGHIAP